MCVGVYVMVCVCMRECINGFMPVYVCARVFLYVGDCVCMHVCMYVYVCVYVYCGMYA